MMHPNTELRYIDDVVGYGIFANAFIPEGTIVYVKDSLEIEVSPEDFWSHPPALRDALEKYSYIDERGYRIVSWDFAKYVNHCCNCNTISTGYGFEIALRDIQAGEQITDEYGIFNLEYEIDLVCSHCDCRKKVGPSDFDNYYQLWDEKILRSLPKLTEVDQPLYGLVDPDLRKQLEEYFDDRSAYKSVYSLKYVKEVVEKTTLSAAMKAA